MKVNCVIVTYNRLELLKECLQAVESQTHPVQTIYIIDNCSTDGTTEYLKAFADRPQYKVVRTESNIGGSGGFSLGTKEAVLGGCDFVWLMDDDTIPSSDTLAHLVAVAGNANHVGFVCSNVLWTNGEPHLMNRPAFGNKENVKGKLLQVGGEDCYACHTCSFVSVLVATDAVEHVGLPIKEFFIWCDDIEYTDRIHRAGYDCYYVPASIVTHKTKLNYFPSIDKAPASIASRFYYQVRNTCYMKHRAVPYIQFLFAVLNKYRLYLHRINKRTDKSNLDEFRRAVKAGCRDGLTFFPQIEFIKR